jgi:cytochrome c
MMLFTFRHSRATSLAAALASSALYLAASCAQAQELRGHGGPVRALAVSSEGTSALSGSFDSSAIIWSLPTGSAQAVLRAHQNAVNAVAVLPQGRFVTAGEDGQLAIWQGPDFVSPRSLKKLHDGPIAALAVSADGSRLASASWDGSFALVSSDGDLISRFTLHQGNVNGVAFSADQKSLVTVAYDATLRITPLDGSSGQNIMLGTALNALSVFRNGEIAAGGADGSLFLLHPDGTQRLKIDAFETPIIALSFAPDGREIAAATPRGSVTIFDVATGKPRFTLNGPGLPVWSLAYMPDGRILLTGGSDRIVRRWDMRSGDHLGPIVLERPSEIATGFEDHPGAEVYKACSACHTLTKDGGNRAGPSLYGVIGRRIGTALGYHYSADFGRHDIVWTKETISRLFELGPAIVTPGTKMPEQKVTSAKDREALVDFIEKASRPR